MPDSPRIAPGATSTITVTFKNKSPKDLPLDFVVDPEPRFDFEVYTLKGDRADKPAGATSPRCRPRSPTRPVPDAEDRARHARPAGHGKADPQVERREVQVGVEGPGQGRAARARLPAEPAGPLKKGTYILRVITPLTGVFEGVDHEVSQPRVQITVAPMP